MVWITSSHCWATALPTLPDLDNNLWRGRSVSSKKRLISCCEFSTSIPSSEINIEATLMRRSERPLGQSITFDRTSSWISVSVIWHPWPLCNVCMDSGRMVSSHFTAATLELNSEASEPSEPSSRSATHSKSRSSFRVTSAANLPCGVPRSPCKYVRPSSMAREGGRQRNKRNVSTPRPASWRNRPGLMSKAVRHDSEKDAQSSSRFCRHCRSSTSAVHQSPRTSSTKSRYSSIFSSIQTNTGVMREIERTGGFPFLDHGIPIGWSASSGSSLWCAGPWLGLYRALPRLGLVNAVNANTTESCHQNPNKLQLAPATELLHHGEYMALSLSLPPSNIYCI